MEAPWLDRLCAVYESYREKATAVVKNRKPGQGLFGLGRQPADDPCHDAFVEELERLLSDFAASGPESAAVRGVLDHVYHWPTAHRKPPSMYWMLIAVHGLTLDLIPLLGREDAAALRTQYAADYPRWERLPVQKCVLAALEAGEQ